VLIASTAASFNLGSVRIFVSALKSYARKSDFSLNDMGVAEMGKRAS
jgi:hypothetical protein